MTFLDAQIIQCLGWVLMDHAEIVSGAYKQRKTQVGNGKDPEGNTVWRDCTDEEKLTHANQTLRAHMQWMSDCVDAKGEEK